MLHDGPELVSQFLVHSMLRTYDCVCSFDLHSSAVANDVHGEVYISSQICGPLFSHVDLSVGGDREPHVFGVGVPSILLVGV